MNKIFLKYIKVATIIFIIFVLVFSLIISQNEIHLETCNEEHCSICAMIHIAQNIINLFIVFTIAILLGVFIFFFLSRLHWKLIIHEQSSLVFQKVQFNE